MKDGKQILLLGATGYIGGTVLRTLLKERSANGITVLIQKSEQSSMFEPLGVNVEVGSRGDLQLLTRLASKSDVVMNFAVAFGGDEASISALISGLESHAKTSGSKPVLLHTGGSGTVLYGKDGERGTDVWTDEQYSRLSSLPSEAYFYGGYKLVADAAARGVISAYTIVSPTVYGAGTGPGNKLSLQMPAYVRYAKQHRQAAYIGKGENVWGNVHVEDLSELYRIVMDFALEHPEQTIAAPNTNGFATLIYSGAGQHTWKPIIETLGDLLFARGEVDKPSAVSIAEGEGFPYMFGGNSFMDLSRKARSLGWQPKQPDLVTSLKAALSS